MRHVICLYVLCMISACKIKQPQTNYTNTVICGGVDDIFEKLPKPKYPYSVKDTNKVYLDIEVYEKYKDVSIPMAHTKLKIHRINQTLLDTSFSYGYWLSKLEAGRYEIELCSDYNPYCINCLKDTFDFQVGSYNQLFIRFDDCTGRYTEQYYCDTIGFKNAILYNSEVISRTPEWLK